MSTAGNSATHRRLRPRLSILVILVVAALAIFGLIYLNLNKSNNGSITIYVAAYDLPVYHQITQADIRPTTVSIGEVPSNAIRDQENLIDHYTLQAIAQGKAFNGNLIGPRLLPHALDGLVIIALDSSAETTLGNRLAKGDRVDILLSPTITGKSDQPERLKNVLVIDIQSNSVTFAATAKDENYLENQLGLSRVAVVRVTAYTEP
jgi:Flp pilus assembly protein CpaB